MEIRGVYEAEVGRLLGRSSTLMAAEDVIKL